MKTAILAIILFCIMIFPHELGHYIAAKKCDVKVNEFAFGMGPTIYKKQKGETLHSIRLLPIGGFCAMEGEDGESDEPRAFNSKKPWQKLIVLFAGAFMNFICAALIMAIVFGVQGFTTTKIAEVTVGQPAYEAGIEVGDKIVAVDGVEIKDWTEFGAHITEKNGAPLSITVKRADGEHTYEVTPVIADLKDEDGNVVQTRYVVGVTCKLSHNPLKALLAGFESLLALVTVVFNALGMLISGAAGISDLSGPVGVVQMVGEAANYGFFSYGYLTAMICANVGVMNLLPLPALDGGRIIFVLISWITGKPVSQKVEGYIHAGGMILLLALMIFVCFNDVLRIIR